MLGIRTRLFAALTALLACGVVSALGVSSSSADVGDPVLMAVGDIACDPANPNFKAGVGAPGWCHGKYTSDLVVGSDAAAVAVLGDEQYACGSLTAYQASYDLNWGRVKDITYPTPGNHEYQTSGGANTTGCTTANTGAVGYFAYFGAAAGQPGQGFYSYDLGSWHIVVLNSNCANVSCGASSAQGQWLQADLAAHPNACTLAYFHHPLFASGGGNAMVKPLWDLLYAADADVVLNGHAHRYERWKPVDPSGVVNPTRGIRQFIVGTGGEDLQTVANVDPRVDSFNQNTFGVLRLQLSDGSYSWQFLPEAGQTFTDGGSAECDPAPDTELPSQPTGLTGSADSATQVSLSWTPSTDNVGVTSYLVLRDGNQIGTTQTPQYTDKTVAGDTSYSYQVIAVDASDNASDPSDSIPITTPTAPPPIEVLTIAVSQDAHVNANKPNTNIGNATPFLVDASPRLRAYLRFGVSGIGSRTVLGATLRLYTSNASADGGSFFRTDGKAWTETGLTWNNQPALVGSAVASAGPATAGTFKQVDVTPLVTGDGTVDIGVTSSSTNDVGYASRQATNGSRRPVLLITVQ